MNPQERLNLIAELETKRDHDVLILAAADIAELRTDFKEVCMDVRENTRRLTILETYWKTFVAIMAAAVIVVPVIVEILLR